MTSRKEDTRGKEPIPEIVVDPSTKKKYRKGKFLGKPEYLLKECPADIMHATVVTTTRAAAHTKGRWPSEAHFMRHRGGFARCYELTDMETNEIFAGKIVSKSLLTKPHQRDKMSQEIDIHRKVNHRHIVGFHGFFEDNDNVYILLELCRRRSLMELHKRRRAITEPECRYFVRQVVLACDYLHKNNIIHRDLKLGNLFLNDDMELKIGDFGLATRVSFNGERKRTMCGTPNYIAPEVLAKKGHSFEVDSWSLGCIVYTLLVGKPPFETSCLKDTYTRIKMNEYHIPSTRVSPSARCLIKRLLQATPASRPNMTQILEHDFLTTGFLPAGLPTSCLTMAPRFDMLKQAETCRKPLLELNELTSSRMPSAVKKDQVDSIKSDVVSARPDVKRSDSSEPSDYYLSDIYSQLTTVNDARPSERPAISDDDIEDPASMPVYWVSKWVDYSDKYGLGYQLCDNSVGVLFNDTTRLLLTRNGDNIQYIERDGSEHFHSLKVFPETLTKKITLLKYFRNYMSEHLLKAGANVVPRDGEEMTRLPFLRTWFRTRSAMVLHLSNGTLQINFFQDHTKIIVCPLMGAVTYIDEKRDFRTYRLKLIEKYGCSKELASRLRYARTMVERLTSSKSGSGRVKSAAPAATS